MLSLAKAHKDYYLEKVGEISPREAYYLKGGAATGPLAREGSGHRASEWFTISAQWSSCRADQSPMRCHEERGWPRAPIL